MTAIVVLVALLAAAGAAASMFAVRRRDAAAARADAEQKRQDRELQDIRRRFPDYVAVAGTGHQRAMVGLRHALEAAQERLTRATARLREEPGAPWSGAQLATRLLVLGVVAVLFVLGLVLNIGIFLGLVGTDSPFGVVLAVICGVIASVLELGLAAILGHLLVHREPRSPAWQARVWGAAAALAIVLILAWTYAPARSTHALTPRIVELELAAEAAANPQDGSPPDPLVVQAAQARAAAERERLQQAQAADQALALLLPAAQVLGFELARDGAIALRALRRKRRAVQEEADARAEVHELRGRVELAERTAVDNVFREAWRAGVDGIPASVAEANARNALPPPELPPSAPEPLPGPPPVHPPIPQQRQHPPQPPSPEPGGDGRTVIDLDGLHRDDAAAWNLAR